MSTIRITSITGKVIVIDPFLIKNPMTPEKYRDLKALGKVDLILVTHGHSDHVRDLADLARIPATKILQDNRPCRFLNFINQPDFQRELL